MRRIKSRNTKPELLVRQILRDLGFAGYRLHRKDLPGKPDIAYIKRKKAIFVHGCFWHGHECKQGQRRPEVRRDYWDNKLTNNQKRDSANINLLKNLGWSVLVIWTCELKNKDAIKNKIIEFMAI